MNIKLLPQEVYNWEDKIDIYGISTIWKLQKNREMRGKAPGEGECHELR